MNKSQIEAFLLGHGLSEHTISSLCSFINVEFSFEKMLNFLRPAMKKDSVIRSLCKEGLQNLEVVINYAVTLGVKVNPDFNFSILLFCNILLLLLIFTYVNYSGYFMRIP